MPSLVSRAATQACAVRLLRPALARLMRTRGARATVFLIGSRLMTVYLWHLPIIIILAGVALVLPLLGRFRRAEGTGHR